METKELKVIIPDGYEIDRENSTFERIKFRPNPKDIITYHDVMNNLGFCQSYSPILCCRPGVVCDIAGLIIALNKLLNIAYYYNNCAKRNEFAYKIAYDECNKMYNVYSHKFGDEVLDGIYVLFNRIEDAQSVIDNPNFREILDAVYKNQIMED